MVQEKPSLIKRYWWLFAGLIAGIALVSALSVSNTDGYLVTYNTTATDWVVNLNTTRNFVEQDTVSYIINARLPSVGGSNCNTVFQGSTAACSFSQGDSAYSTIQLSHQYVLGSDVNCHVHLVFPNNNTGTTIFGIEYTGADINDTFPVTTTRYCSAVPPRVAYNHTLCDIGSIGNFTGPSGIVMFRLFRNTTGDSYGSGVFALSLDCHIQAAQLSS